MEAIYERPRDYDLEHEGDDEDVAFYVRLLNQLRPSRVLELACGSGRVTAPLAAAAARIDCDIVGLELAPTMLDVAREKCEALDEEVRRRVSFVQADMREWRSDVPFDLIVTPCSSLTHLLSVDDQLRTWRCAADNLGPGGRFVADLTMPDLGAYAESLQVPPRTLLEIDIDTRDPVTGTRLLRYKTTRYVPHAQRAEIRFLYDKFPDGAEVDRYVSDFECHVYYPRELELLFRITGFTVERTVGSYDMRPLAAASRQLIMVGRKA